MGASASRIAPSPRRTRTPRFAHTADEHGDGGNAATAMSSSSRGDDDDLVDIAQLISTLLARGFVYDTHSAATFATLLGDEVSESGKVRRSALLTIERQSPKAYARASAVEAQGEGPAERPTLFTFRGGLNAFAASMPDNCTGQVILEGVNGERIELGMLVRAGPADKKSYAILELLQPDLAQDLLGVSPASTRSVNARAFVMGDELYARRGAGESMGISSISGDGVCELEISESGMVAATVESNLGLKWIHCGKLKRQPKTPFTSYADERWPKNADAFASYSTWYKNASHADLRGREIRASHLSSELVEAFRAPPGAPAKLSTRQRGAWRVPKVALTIGSLAKLSLDKEEERLDALEASAKSDDEAMERQRQQQEEAMALLNSTHAAHRAETNADALSRFALQTTEFQYGDPCCAELADLRVDEDAFITIDGEWFVPQVRDET